MAVSRVRGLAYRDLLLVADPIAETGAVDCTYTPTYASGKVTLEEWKRDDATLIESIAYTYSGNKVATSVRKVFANDGTTVTAQLTWTYSYSGAKLSSATMVRDV